MKTIATRLSGRQLEFVALGGTIGAGLFLGLGQGIRVAGPSLLLAYAVTGAMVFVIARCLAEMALADHQPRTFLSYTAENLGARIAFVQGWSYWICAILVCMAEVTAIGVFVRAWLPMVPPWAVALGAVLALFLINRASVRVFGEVEFWMSLLKIATIIAFLLLGAFLLLPSGIAALPHAAIANLWSDGGFFPTGFGGFLAVLPVALFAFGGTELIGIAAAEAEDPQRTVPRATNALLGRVALFYLGTTFIVLTLMPWRSVPADASPLVKVLAEVGLPSAATMMTVVVISASLSACNSALYASSRILRALAEMKAAPHALVKPNANGVPERATLLSTAVISLSVLLNYLLPAMLFQLLLGMAALTVVTNWALFLIAHLRFRQRPAGATARRFPVPLAPWSNYAVLLSIAVVLLVSIASPDLRLASVLALGMFATLFALAQARRH